MQIWHYDRTTGELLGTSSADQNPMEKGEWLVPAFATRTAPGEPQSGRVDVFNGVSWESVADHRGEVWWRAGAEFNTEPVTIDFIGDPVEQGLTNVEPPAPPVVEPPIVVSARQIRLALNQMSFRANVEGWVQAADQDTKDTWQYGTEFARADSPVTDAAEAYDKTAEWIDELFELAKTL